MDDLIRRITLALTVGVFVVVVGGMAFVTLYRLGHWAGVDGPNTVGEAGKVYFAHRFAVGKTLFTSAEEPPYYASMHGALLHASVGMIGKVLGLPAQSLYGVGRAISILGTVVALIVARQLLIALGVQHVGWFLAVFAAFFASEPVTEHAVSYRPDHWNLALSAICCWLLVAHPGKRWRLWLLAVIPAVAFFIKAPGLALAIPIALALAAERKWKQGVVCAIAAVVLTGIAMALIEWSTEGRFSAGLRSGLSMPVSIKYFLVLVRSPQHWIAWIVPLVLVGNALPVRDETHRRWMVVMSFWLTAFVVSAAGSMRAGSNTYYFVDSFLYGLILTAAWIAHLVRSNGEGYRTAAAIVLTHSLLYAHLLIFYAPTSIPIREETSMDISIRTSRLVGTHRLEMARTINDQEWKCFSDDAGLNILLDQPETIYPLMQSMMVKQGAISMADMVGPVEREAYDVLVLTGIVWDHMGVKNLPREFQDAVNRHYVEIQDDETPYAVFLPRSRVRGGQ